MFYGGTYALLAVVASAFTIAAMSANLALWDAESSDGDWFEIVAYDPRKVVNQFSSITRVGVDNKLTSRPSNPHQKHLRFRATLWEICSRDFHYEAGEACRTAVDPALTCASVRATFETIQAFYMLTLSLSIVALIFAVLDHGNFREFKYYKPVLAGIAVFIVGFSAVGWSVAISAVHRSFCEHTVLKRSMISQPEFEWGASVYLLLVSSVLGLTMLVVALRHPQHATDHIVF
jgi:hypothetical protein